MEILHEVKDLNKKTFLYTDTGVFLNSFDSMSTGVLRKVNTREIHLCSHTGKPMFAQLGNSVKYVKGSGKESY